MDFQSYFPIWNKLTAPQQERILGSLMERKISKGTVIHNGSMDCTGLLLVKSGQLRAYILSDEGREITIYRLFDRDMCLFSASCIMRSIQFEVTIETEKDTELWIIPAEIYQSIMEESALVSNYTNELMAISESMLGAPWNRVRKPTLKYLLLTASTGSSRRNWVKAKVMAFSMPNSQTGRGQFIMWPMEI